MFCPKCQSELLVKNSFSSKSQGAVQNCICSNPKCRCVVVVQKVVTAVDPPRGKGFTAIANRMKVRDRNQGRA